MVLGVGLLSAHIAATSGHTTSGLLVPTAPFLEDKAASFLSRGVRRRVGRRRFLESSAQGVVDGVNWLGGVAAGGLCSATCQASFFEEARGLVKERHTETRELNLFS